MRAKTFIFSLMAILALCIGQHPSLLAAKKAVKKEKQHRHSSSSSSSSKKHHKKKKCCKQVLELAQHIDQTTIQDLIVDQSTLGLVNQINQTTRADLAVDEEILDIVTAIKDCSCKCQLILPRDFEDINGNLTQTYVITEPGSYCFGADVNFAPEDDFVPAIQILSDNVNIDLGGFRLNQASSSLSLGILIGLELFNINPDFVLKNISISNGSITNFKAIGIGCWNGTFDVNPNAGASYKSLEFKNLNVLDCGSNPNPVIGAGIVLGTGISPNSLSDEYFPIAFDGVRVENCSVNRCLGSIALGIVNGNDIIISDTQVNECTNTVFIGFSTTAYYVFGSNIQMYRCQGNGTKALDPNDPAQVGSFFSRCINVYLKDCQFNDTYGESNSIVNFNPSNSLNFVAEDCQFNNSRGGLKAQLITGIHMSDFPFQNLTADCMKFINCQFNGTSVNASNALFPTVGGFRAITERNVIFENCEACSTSNFTGGDTLGFGLFTSASDPIPFYANNLQISFLGCTVSDIVGSAFTVGFDVGPTSDNRIGQQPRQSNYIFDNCIVERIRALDPTGTAIGIEGIVFTDSRSPTVEFANVFIRNCLISDVHGNPATVAISRNAGITLSSVKRPVLEGNSITDCDRGILFLGNGSITPSTRFQLASTLANATALPPVFVDLIGNTTYTTGTALQTAFGFVSAGTTIIGSGTTFTPAMEGGTIQFGSVAGTGSQAMDIVTATTPVFTSSMLGDTITFPNSAYSAYIVNFLSPTRVQVDRSLPSVLASQPFTVNIGITPITAFIDPTHLEVARTNFIVPSQPYTITYGFPTGTQTFNNITQGNMITLVASNLTVSFSGDRIASPTSMNTLGWKAGDQITYTAPSLSETIPGLVSGQTYFLVNSTPGFCDDGVVQNNTVSKCLAGGYVEARLNVFGALVTNIVSPTGVALNTVTTLTVATTAVGQQFPNSGTLWVETSAGFQILNYTGKTATTFTGCSSIGTGIISAGGLVTVPGALGAGTTTAWINNVAVNNGTPSTDATNYSIAWIPGPSPVEGGFVGGPFPAGSKYFNLSLKP